MQFHVSTFQSPSVLLPFAVKNLQVLKYRHNKMDIIFSVGLISKWVQLPMRGAGMFFEVLKLLITFKFVS